MLESYFKNRSNLREIPNVTGPTQLNLFTNHITLDNEYMRCDHKRQEMTKLLRTKNNKIPEI